LVDERTLDEAVNRRIRELQRAFSRRRLGILWRLDPELRHILARILRAVEDALQLRDARKLDESAQQAIARILLDAEDLRTVDAAAEVVDAFDQILIAHGDDTYLYCLLSYESWEERRRAKRQAAPTVGWSELFPKAELSGLLSARPPWNEAQRADARRKLRGLARARSDAYRLQRARIRTRNLYLLSLAPILAALVGGLAFAIEWSSDDPVWESIGLAAVAGAVGSTLSGVYKLRDHIRRIGELRAFRASMIVQPLVGAAAGLVLLLVLESPLLMTEGDEDVSIPWATKGLLAFAAGFS
jgi:hypothetical protein